MFRSLASLLLLVVSSTVVAQTQRPPPAPIYTVWRADTRPPSVVFERGFIGRGSRVDLLAHALDSSCEAADPALASAWVSTTSDRGEAIGFAMGRLSALQVEGPASAMWLYEIRPDVFYTSVRGVMQQVIDAGRAGRDGYMAHHADALQRLMMTTVLGAEREVVTHYVRPTHIHRATAVYYANGRWHEDTPIEHEYYQPYDSQATHQVSDPAAYVPPIGILRAYDNHATSCAMSCDGSTSGAGPMLLTTVGQTPAYCKAARKRSGTLLETILLRMD